MKKRLPPQRRLARVVIDRKALEGFQEGILSDWEAIKEVLDYLGYEAKYVHVTPGSKRELPDPSKVIPFPVSRTEHQLARKMRGKRFKKKDLSRAARYTAKR
jgi:hypothetical protein